MQYAYPVVIETDDAGGYSAFFPDLPGCAGAGDSVESCFQDARDALALHLAGMIEDGDAPPVPTLLPNVEVNPAIRIAALRPASPALRQE